MRPRRWIIVATLMLGLLLAAGSLAFRAMLPPRVTSQGPVDWESPLGRLWHDAGVAEKAGDDRRAIDLYTRALREPRVDWAIRGILLGHRANAFERLHQFDAAEADWTARLKIVPLLASYYKDRGAFFVRRGAPDQALADYRAALARSPKDAEVARRVKELEAQRPKAGSS